MLRPFTPVPLPLILQPASADSRREELLKFTARNPPVRPPLRCIALPRRRRPAVRPLSLTRSTRLTRFTQRRSVLTLTRSLFPSRITARTRFQLRKLLRAPAHWTLLLLTRLPRLFRGRKLRARWATATSVSTQGLCLRLCASSQALLQKAIRSLFSSISCAKRSASYTAVRRLQPADAH